MADTDIQLNKDGEIQLVCDKMTVVPATGTGIAILNITDTYVNNTMKANPFLDNPEGAPLSFAMFSNAKEVDYIAEINLLRWHIARLYAYLGEMPALSGKMEEAIKAAKWEITP